MTHENRSLCGLSLSIDLTSLQRKLTGLETYSLQLAKAMVQIRPDTHLVFSRVYPEFQNHENKTVLDSRSQLITEQIRLPGLSHGKQMLFLFPCFPPGFLMKKPFIVMCHDATMWRYPQTLSVKNRLYFKPLMERGMKRAERILTVSESSKRELQYFFPQYSDKIRNIGAALPKSFVPMDTGQVQEILRKFRLKNRFVLSVGTVEPRKNLAFTIRSMAPVLKREELTLVIAGRSAWGSSEVEKIIESQGLESNVIRTGYITDSELQALYSTAQALLFPSLYEGFGLPVLEAFSCGCPVVTSDVSSMPEVAGNAALLIDPTKPEELRRAVERVMYDFPLREQLIKKGFERLKSFSWIDCAGRLLKNMEELCQK